MASRVRRGTCEVSEIKKAVDKGGWCRAGNRRRGSRLVRTSTTESRIPQRETSSSLPTEWKMHCDSSCPLFAEYLDHVASAGWGELLQTDDVDVGPGDALIVVDMQNDRLPVDRLNPLGGRLAVKEGEGIVPLVCSLMEHFASAGASVVATKDYHPEGHCSFLEANGPFPAHCLQGSPGSFFYDTIGKALQLHLNAGRDVEVVFKGFHEDVDSPGAFKYADEEATWDRIPNRTNTTTRLHGFTHSCWTGAYGLKCSQQGNDINSPPDILSAFERKAVTRQLKMKKVKRLFVCGLALDCSVMDTAINAALHSGFSDVSIILDACRASHIGAVGLVGSGFLNDPCKMYSKFDASGIKLRPSAAFLPMLIPINPISADRPSLDVFPHTLGPFTFVSVPEVSILLDRRSSQYKAQQPRDILNIYESHGVECAGKTSPISPIVLDPAGRRQLGIPDEATHFCWVYPLGAGDFAESARGYLSASRPSAAFFFFGGFIYMDEAGEIVSAKALSVGGRGLHFDAPRQWTGQMTVTMQKGWQPVTFPFARSAGARRFCFVPPCGCVATVNSNGRKQTVDVGGPRGGFAFLFHDENEANDERDRYFTISDLGVLMPEELTDMCALTKIRRYVASGEAECTQAVFVKWSGGTFDLFVDQFYCGVSAIDSRISRGQSGRLFGFADSNKDGIVGFPEFAELLAPE